MLYARSCWRLHSKGRHLDDVRAGRRHNTGSRVGEAVAIVLCRAPHAGRLDADDRRGNLLLLLSAVAAVHLIGLHVEIRATRGRTGHIEDFNAI